MPRCRAHGGAFGRYHGSVALIVVRGVVRCVRGDGELVRLRRWHGRGRLGSLGGAALHCGRLGAACEQFGQRQVRRGGDVDAVVAVVVVVAGRGVAVAARDARLALALLLLLGLVVRRLLDVVGAMDAQVLASVEASVADGAVVVDPGDEDAVALGVVETRLLGVARALARAPAARAVRGRARVSAGARLRVGRLVFRDHLLDESDGLGEVSFWRLDLQPKVELRLDRVAEEAYGVDVDLRRDHVLLASFAHLACERLVRLSERVEGDDGWRVDSSVDKLRPLRGSPRGEVVVGLGHLLSKEHEEVDAAGTRLGLVVLTRLLVGDGVAQLIK